jgi:deleted-in-malignant-brain-tumors protein 1
MPELSASVSINEIYYCWMVCTTPCFSYSLTVCEDGEVRLVGGGSDLTVGRVDICLNQTWGSVCGDSWDDTDAGVVCNHLGYQKTSAYL